MEFKNAALILKDVIYSGKITDTKSLHFLREQHDKFSRLHRVRTSLSLCIYMYILPMKILLIYMMTLL